MAPKDRDLVGLRDRRPEPSSRTSRRIQATTAGSHSVQARSETVMGSVVRFVFVGVPHLSAQDDRTAEAPKPSQIVPIIGGGLVDVAKGTSCIA